MSEHANLDIIQTQNQNTLANVNSLLGKWKCIFISNETMKIRSDPKTGQNKAPSLCTKDVLGSSSRGTCCACLHSIIGTKCVNSSPGVKAMDLVTGYILTCDQPLCVGFKALFSPICLLLSKYHEYLVN